MWLFSVKTMCLGEVLFVNVLIWLEQESHLFFLSMCWHDWNNRVAQSSQLVQWSTGKGCLQVSWLKCEQHIHPEFHEVSKGASLWREAPDSLVAYNSRCIPEELQSLFPCSWTSKDRSTITPRPQEGIPKLEICSLDNQSQTLALTELFVDILEIVWL